MKAQILLVITLMISLLFFNPFLVAAQVIGTHEESDNSAPLIINVSNSPKYPLNRDKVLITATVVDDDSGVKNVWLSYYSIINFAWYGQNWGWGEYEWEYFSFRQETRTQNVLMMAKGNNTYEAEIKELPYMTKVIYQVYAVDNNGNLAVSDVHVYYVVRGGPSIIMEQVGGILSWAAYLSVALILVIRSRKE